MTGREKIIEAINLIDHHTQESLSGNVVKLSSDDFDNAGLRLEDQTSILDALKDDYECIKYSFTRPYKKKSEKQIRDIVPNDVYLLADFSDIDPTYFIGKRLSRRDYTIEVLNNFDEVKSKAQASELQKYEYHSAVLTDRPRSSTNVDYDNLGLIYVSLHNNVIIVGLRPGAFVPLGKPLRYDSPPYNFMRYILKNSDRAINIHEIQEKVEGCKTKTDLSELVRNCHFDKELKRIFFERTTQKTIRFTPWKEISGEQLKWFEKWLETAREQTELNREKSSS